MNVAQKYTENLFTPSTTTFHALKYLRQDFLFYLLQAFPILIHFLAKTIRMILS